jgi:hypothetical protein
MSHQPSTIDNVRSAASLATHAVAETLDPAPDSGSGIVGKVKESKKTDEKGSYKDQLTKAAIEGGQPENEGLAEKGIFMFPYREFPQERDSNVSPVGLRELGFGPLNSDDWTLLISKVCSYIPGIGALQHAISSKGTEGEEQDKKVDYEAPPKRPEHDLQIEEFLKEQYKSHRGAGMPDVGQAKTA